MSLIICVIIVAYDATVSKTYIHRVNCIIIYNNSAWFCLMNVALEHCLVILNHDKRTTTGPEQVPQSFLHYRNSGRKSYLKLPRENNNKLLFLLG